MPEISCLPVDPPPPVSFAISEIQARGGPCGRAIHIAIGSDASRHLSSCHDCPPPEYDAPQSYALRLSPNGILVLGADAVGAMYGALEIADAIRDRRLDALIDVDRRPAVEHRGIKYNLPLDLRTPSYSDCGDAAQQAIPAIWDLDFWRSFLDEMARDRFDVLSLWNLHPFPSMVRVPEFPEVALDDVWRTTLPIDPLDFSLRGEDMVRPDMLAAAEVIQRMTIDDKIAHWRAVMAHAHDRGIEVFIFTWNIFTFGAEGRHGISCDQRNPTTLDYFRCSVRELVLTYPLLAGIGITAGENMHPEADNEAKEEWLWQAYGEGVRAALARQPGRRLRLIHRAHETGYQAIAERWRDFPGTCDLSFKYAIAHVYSSPTPPFANEALPHMPAGWRTWMTVRNDDHYCFRWGDPDFVRAFVQHLPGPDRCAGLYFGPDGYVWARDGISRNPDPACPLEIQRQWYAFRIWGLLCYDPGFADEIFSAMLAARFPEVDAQRLFAAGRAASAVVPLVNRAHWNPLDFQFLPEAGTANPLHAEGFHGVDRFMRGRSMPGSGILSPADFCREEGAGTSPPSGITPIQVIDELRSTADRLDTLLTALPSTEVGELGAFIDDWRALAQLARYYAAMFAAALELLRSERDSDPSRHAAAVTAVDEALAHWQAYAAIATSRYRQQAYNRIGHVDLDRIGEDLRRDGEAVRAWTPTPRSTT